MPVISFVRGVVGISHSTVSSAKQRSVYEIGTSSASRTVVETLRKAPVPGTYSQDSVARFARPESPPHCGPYLAHLPALVVLVERQRDIASGET